MFEDLTTAGATAHRRDLARDAAVARLARLARCCQPSALRRHGERVLAWLRSTQLGAGYVTPAEDRLLASRAQCH